MAIGIVAGLQSSNNDLKLNLSKNFISLNKNESTTITVDTPSDGKIYVTSSNPNIVTASISNNIITINAIKSGSVIITIGQDAGTGIYTNITSKITQLFVLIPFNSILENNSWEDISEVSKMGTGNQYWSIGDTKSITLNGKIGNGLTLNNFACKVFILHFNYPINGVADNNIIWGGFKDNDGVDIALIDYNYNNDPDGPGLTDGTICFNMNHWGNYNYGGWKGCDLRYDILGATSTQPSDYGKAHTTACIGYDATSATLINPKANTLLAALPANFRNNLRLWSRWIDAVGNASNVDANIKETVDAVTLLAEFEVLGEGGGANQYEQNHQSQMEYYRLGNSGIKYKPNNSSSHACWYCASPGYYEEDFFTAIIPDNSAGHDPSYDAYSVFVYAYYSYAVAPAFMT